MGRPALVTSAALLAAAVLAGCGAEGVVGPTPVTCVGSCSSAAPKFPIVPAFHLKGASAKGKSVFLANCSSCHTLAAAGSTGTIGPDLDAVKPNYQAVTAQVTLGPAGPLKGAMPSFKKTLSTQQIADVAAYVVDSTGGKAP